MDSKDWDQLNDETFASDVSDDDFEGHDWEDGHFDFVAKQKQRVKPRTAHPSRPVNNQPLSRHNYPTSQANFANVGSAQSTERVPQSDFPTSVDQLFSSSDRREDSQFEIEEDKFYFDQSFARSFDDIFTEEDTPNDDVTLFNASGSSGRQKNDSVSELFPDSFKFSPPLPPLNFAEFGDRDIWNPEEQENDLDYINKHIKSLLNINHSTNRKSEDRPSANAGSSKSSQQPSRVYTLEELETGIAPKDVPQPAPSSNHIPDNGPGASKVAPIGTPPDAHHSGPLSFAQFQQMMVDAQKMFQSNPTKHNLQAQFARMGITDPSVIASLLRSNPMNNQQVPPGFMMPGNASQNSPYQRQQGHQRNQMMQNFNPRNMPYPHPIPQGGRMQNRGNNQRNFNLKYPNQRMNAQQLQREKIVKGLMTEKEIEWIFKVQLMQLKMQDVDAEDFYYRQWMISKKRGIKLPSQQTGSTEHSGKRPEKDQNGTAVDGRQSPSVNDEKTSRDDRLNQTSGSKPVTQSPGNKSPPLGNPDRSAQAAENSSNKSYEPTRFENTLGKISVGSIYQPRKLLDIDYVTRERTVAELKNLTSLRESKRYREHLLFIEKSLMIFEDLEPKFGSDGASKNSQLEHKQLSFIMKHMDFDHIDEIVKNLLLCGNKGCRFMGCLLPRLTSDRQISLMLSVLTHLFILFKKETTICSFFSPESKRPKVDPLFALSLCEAFTIAVRKLESNIDKLEMVELLVSTTNWKLSRFAMTFFVTLCESIAVDKDIDKFCFDRLVEILSGVEENLSFHTKSDSFDDDCDKYVTKPSTGVKTTRAPFFAFIEADFVHRFIQMVDGAQKLPKLTQFLCVCTCSQII